MPRRQVHSMTSTDLLEISSLQCRKHLLPEGKEKQLKSFVRPIVVLLVVLTGVSAQEMALQGKWKIVKERSSDLDYFQYATIQFALSTSEIDRFLSFFTNSSSKSETLQAIESNWKPEYEVLLIEVAYLLRDPISAEIIRTLEKKTNQDFGRNFNSWYAWLWNKEQKILPDYDYFKARLYRPIDPRFEKYFLDRGHTSSIRLDEIRWGGVKQDEIPPLRSPHMLEADEASYLDDDDIVFGIDANGDVRAYPKRILAWHEMFVDTVCGIPVAGVSCTLCGTVILYKAWHNGIHHQLGTSGFLYRSNKLMYDKATPVPVEYNGRKTGGRASGREKN